MKQALLAVVAIAVLGFCVVGGCMWQGYNKAISLDEGVKKEWAEVENQLQRRFDLVPNLVETVKGYASHETEVFGRIAEARESYFQAKESGDVAGQVKASNSLGGALSRLLLLKENYPNLKANESFLTLQSQLEGTENRLTVARKRYNDAVFQLNRYVRGFAGRLIASIAKVNRAEPFEVAEEARAAPQVDFGNSGPGE